MYPSAQIRLGGYPKGLPKNMTQEQLRTKSFINADSFFVYIEILAVKKRLNLPYMSKKKDSANATGSSRNEEEDEGRDWTNDMVGTKCVVNDTTLKTWIKYHDISYRAINGIYFYQGRNNQLSITMEKLFEKRKKYTAEGNPMQLLFKLIMNSSYGKTIERPHEIGIVYLDKNIGKTKTRSLADIHYKYSGTILILEHLKNCYKLRYRVGLIEHYNPAHCGSLTLSMSKLIMAEVMVDVDDYVLYTDTDSMFILKEGLEKLKELKPGIMGDNPGQFHIDFPLGGTNPRMIKGTFAGKKCYYGESINDEGETAIMVVLKGIPKKSVEYVVKKHYRDNYLLLFDGFVKRTNGVVFDLLVGEQHRFKFNFNQTILSKSIFIRTIKL